MPTWLNCVSPNAGTAFIAFCLSPLNLPCRSFVSWSLKLANRLQTQSLAETFATPSKSLRSTSSSSTSKITAPPHRRRLEDAGNPTSLWDSAFPSIFASSASGMGVRFDSRSSGSGFKWSILKNLNGPLLGYASTTGSKANLPALIP